MRIICVCAIVSAIISPIAHAHLPGMYTTNSTEPIFMGTKMNAKSQLLLAHIAISSPCAVLAAYSDYKKNKLDHALALINKSKSKTKTSETQEIIKQSKTKSPYDEELAYAFELVAQRKRKEIDKWKQKNEELIPKAQNEMTIDHLLKAKNQPYAYYACMFEALQEQHEKDSTKPKLTSEKETEYTLLKLLRATDKTLTFEGTDGQQLVEITIARDNDKTGEMIEREIESRKTDDYLPCAHLIETDAATNPLFRYENTEKTQHLAMVTEYIDRICMRDFLLVCQTISLSLANEILKYIQINYSTLLTTPPIYNIMLSRNADHFFTFAEYVPAYFALAQDCNEYDQSSQQSMNMQEHSKKTIIELKLQLEAYKKLNKETEALKITHLLRLKVLFNTLYAKLPTYKRAAFLSQFSQDIADGGIMASVVRIEDDIITKKICQQVLEDKTF